MASVASHGVLVESRHRATDQAADRTGRRDPRDIAIAIALGLLVALFTWWVWGSWKPPGVGSDETAYLLQARIFASGRAVAEARPFPEFFWQYHVFVDPVLAAKYPPGHSALLALGAIVGGPWLIPLLVAGICAALLYSLARRWTGRDAAALAVALAATSGISMRFWPSYFSEPTTATRFLVASWTTVQHR